MTLDLYLRSPDQAALYAALEAAGLMVTSDSGARIPMQASHAHALDVIGDLVKTPAVVEARGGVWDKATQEWVGGEIVVITPAVMVGAYHANLRLLAPNPTIEAALASVTMGSPGRPQRVWA